ncbi:dynein light chain roadblock-type 2-like [Lytechinus pictus]|uniref:dynein light chain roadblock-type 2-like n=1 Tax=Lytechinus variegatus TaxID=7654 RepID=UPI001BB1DC18|nr:dynein light chain roadblock-type 2-like [Lytechinus variegatus]XP_041455067.1 dynein light chain roadblock-type 2-like [Lytechinus variegatus]XP_054748549.1 dynein light chain roadblock-type 2-like [Lytechinus pictus]
MAEVEDIVKRLMQHPGVTGVVIASCEGIPIRTTFNNEKATHYAARYVDLINKARRCVQDTDPTNDLSFVRVRTKAHEIMVAPDKDFILIVTQKPSEAC